MMQGTLLSFVFSFILFHSSQFARGAHQTTADGAILINAGGPTFVDTLGNVWETNAIFPDQTGESYQDESPIAGTSDEALYQSQQIGTFRTPLKFEIPVAKSGVYNVYMHFAEIQPASMAVGARVFDVLLEGNMVIENLDVYSEVGHHTALIKAETITVTGESLSIEFRHEGAMISAIEVLPLSTTSRRLQQASLPLLINVGGSEFVDSNGRTWIKDSYYNNGGEIEPRNVPAVDIKNTVDDALYQTARFDSPSTPRLEYNIPLPNGFYQVALHFSENYEAAQKVGRRKFNVLIEGAKAFSDLDIYKESGAYTPLIKRKTVRVTDGSLQIAFENVKQNAKVSAIEVHPGSSSGSTSDSPEIVYRINAGAGTYVDTSGNRWSPDSYFNSGGMKEPWTGGSKGIQGTEDDMLYKSGRFDRPKDPKLAYDLPVLNGKYQVVMHYAETYNPITAAGQRVFDVFLEGKKVLDRFDVFQEAGGSYIAVKKTATVDVNDGRLTLTFGKHVENAKINAIEVYSIGSSNAPVPNEGPASLATAPVYVNCGGNEIKTSSGIVWQKDKYFNNGAIERSFGGLRNIFGTTNDVLYQTARYDASASGPPLQYNVPIANGDYTVTLHWADIYGPTQKIGGRVFDVTAQGSTVLNDVDIFRAVGANTVMTKSFPVKVTNKVLLIGFKHVSENPKLSALEIHAGTSTVPSPKDQFPLYINAGGEALTDSNGISWIEDSYYNNGGKIEKSFGSREIAGADGGSSIYLTGRYDPKSRPSLQYSIPCPNGEYTVALHFAELYPEVFSIGARSFSVKIEDVVVLKDLDIYKASGGGYTALVETVWTTVSDGKLSIEFIHGVENPKISAISVHKGKLPGASSPPGPSPSSPPAPGPTNTPSPASGKAIYINTGGKSSFTDAKGNKWIADKYFNTGNSEPLAVGSITGTLDDGLFWSGRFDPKSGASLKYEVPLSSNGSYDVSLYFAETYGPAMKTGARVFDITINGSKTYKDFDIYKEAKAGNKALKKTTRVNVTNKKVIIEFSHVTENPKINAISIVPSVQQANAPPTSAPKPTLPIRINAGGKSYTDNSGKHWIADSYDNNGGENEILWNPVATIYGTADDKLYMTAKYDASPEKPALIYDIPVPNGVLEVTLHFCELYSKAMYKGVRVFDVLIEGKKMISGLDIYSEAGGFTALKKTFDVVVNDNKLSIGFGHIKENPKISAIEIHEKKKITTVSSALAPPPIQSSYMINIGGDTYKDSKGRTWQADYYYNDGGEVESVPNSIPAISKTLDDELYASARYDPDSGPGLKYEFPVPDGDYELTLHFCELWKRAFQTNARVFDVLLEGAAVISDLDIFKESGQFTALKKTAYASVNDGFLTLEFGHKVNNPKLSALEIKPAVIPEGRSHRAHAVPGGPYVQTDVDGDGFEVIKVDGTFSHTHTAGSTVDKYTWKVNDKVVGNGMITEITLPVGFHTLTLDVVDSDGDTSSDYTTVNVKPQGFPDIESLSPEGGDVTGGEKVLIKGSGFASPASKTKVHFGSTTLTGSQITVVSENLIEVKKAPASHMGPATVTVDTEIGPSNKAYFLYSDKTLPPVNFNFGVTTKGVFGPTTVAFGPDGKLYIGTQAGNIVKASLDSDYKVIESTKVISSIIAESEPDTYRSILGITFDPMDVSPNPTVYVAHCALFHGNIVDYNGKVSAVSGANLDKMEHVVTGLPVSDHDHGINGMEFDDNGDLLIQVGGNTNAGVPGAVSSTGLQEEGELSAATVVAHVSRPGFDGKVTYDSDGDVTSGTDVEVWASGQRNAFDLVLHSNGNIYGTDNGPNNKYGAKSFDCDTQGSGPSQGSDPHEDDELNLLEKGKYYGHANRKRGDKDPRQCKWRSTTEKSDADYVAPMHMLPASSNGITEFQTRHFGGQLRGHLLIGRYKGALFHVALSDDGRSVVGQHHVLAKKGGLDVIQGPDGTLFVAQNAKGQVVYHTPTEPPLGKLHVSSVFPRRGPKAGGSTLSLYGEEFGSSPNVTVGGKNCVVQSKSANKITCKLPPGSGKADIVVTSGGQTDTFTEGYRFISGKP